ncbi:MAG: acetyl/propionyl/methylcrotonyl-CoA carboxylase subunit alpha [Magnetococcales bacterium]|nr:acetyl/propionyl/methylcrotonyl-CoA carboxylase subunit alpha [Magnetococcales bacterium]
MMKKILIANRGEIVCRVIRTAKSMGIKTVAVYSEADKETLFVRQADEAVCVGPAASAESYLVVENILKAIDETGADAVHPGYGFLSENADFCKALQERGVTFIGPGVHAIQSMGDKIESKKIAHAAGVNTIPGHDGVITSVTEAVKVSNQVGYPVMIKASAGGGGKGMRIAHNDDEAAEGWEAASNEGRSYFNDDRVFIEKFIVNPRHIEIQIIADSHGNILYLNERECSIQRRNQKVIEEAPSPFVTPEMRKSMGEQAVKLAREVGYVSAGTVEFVVGSDRSFYFLEMNTRLQVEHPITEKITGLDLVEQMIRVARGEKLSITQEEVPLRGWAIECRVYAENPYRNFMPSTGRLIYYRSPVEDNRVRVDSGVFEGGEVSMYYDPMISKLISWGRDRDEAIVHMEYALDDYLIQGPEHNLDLLNTIIRHPRFQRGELTTNFIAEEFPKGFYGAPATEKSTQAFAIAAAIIEQEDTGLFDEIPITQDLVVTVDKQEIELTIEHKEEELRLITFNGEEPLHVPFVFQPGARMVKIFMPDYTGTTFRIRRRAEGYLLSQGGRSVTAITRTPRHHELAKHMLRKMPPDMSRMLISPMPGLVLKVMVGVGQVVNAGQPLCILEAMKMENLLRAEQDGKVKLINVTPGKAVETDEVLMEFE